MIVAGKYPFKDGEQSLRGERAHLLEEIELVISSVDSEACKQKISREKTMPGRVLYDPRALNGAFTEGFASLGWEKARIRCDYPTQFYTPGYRPTEIGRGAFREMDFVKDDVGVEVQFGKYAFMVYNVCAKMTIFNKNGFIDVGVEIVPMRRFAREMSTGVSYFEQFVWDLEQRGTADIDIPVLVLGVDTERSLDTTSPP